MKDDELVVVRTYLNRVDAEIARGVLESVDIDSMITADDMGGIRPSLWMAGVKLLVRREDAERASQTLGPEA
jgi:hypothetical protein